MQPEYQNKSSHYPLQRRVKGDEILRVQVATREQQASSTQGTRITLARLPLTIPLHVGFSQGLVAQIESVLKQEIDERTILSARPWRTHLHELLRHPKWVLDLDCLLDLPAGVE